MNYCSYYCYSVCVNVNKDGIMMIIIRLIFSYFTVKLLIKHKLILSLCNFSLTIWKIQEQF